MLEKETKRIINLKFRGIDDWGRPVFKDLNSSLHVCSVNTLFNYSDEPKKVVDYFTQNPNELELYGYKFPCEPHGGTLRNVEYQFTEL